MTKKAPTAPRGPAATRPITLSFRTSAPTKKAAARLAKAEHRTLSQWIELLVLDAIKKAEGRKE
jgi:hypothetical protein